MVLTIDGIQRMNHNIFCDREIVKIDSVEHFGAKHYVFHFDALPGYQPHAYPEWEDKFAIHFVREPKNGSYELYWMGLHGVTNELIPKSEIENKSLFLMNLNKVIDRAKDYYTQLNPF